MIAMQVLGLQVDPASGQPLLLLREQDEPRRVLPLMIGVAEARSIALGLDAVAAPRPITHELMLQVLAGLEVTVERVDVTALRNGTFYAEIFLAGPRGRITVSSRPSDAIALAVRVRAPVFAAPAVLDEAGAVVQEVPAEVDAELDEFRQFLDEIDPSDFG
jgi:hypothetical protein